MAEDFMEMGRGSQTVNVSSDRQCPRKWYSHKILAHDKSLSTEFQRVEASQTWSKKVSEDLFASCFV